jgi:hypothetical protein
MVTMALIEYPGDIRRDNLRIENVFRDLVLRTNDSLTKKPAKPKTEL